MVREVEEGEKALIIGITGAPGSGKSTAANFLEMKGFRKIIFSSFLEGEAQKQGVTLITREVLQDIGNSWRRKYGAGVLAVKVLALLQEIGTKYAVVDGIRNVEEISELRKNEGFTLFAIISNREERYQRLWKRGGRESLTLKLFNRLDDQDHGQGQDKNGLQVTACQALADFTIHNEGNKQELEEKLDNLLRFLGMDS